MNTQLFTIRGPVASRRTYRGNVLIMVVVVLVLLAMLGASYLQMARVQRITDAEPINNIDLVLQSVIDEIARLLKADVTGDNADEFFAPSLDIEPYDYPWTKATAAAPVADPLRTGAWAAIQSHPPTNDDRWLASTSPTFSGGMTWPKISILGRYYVERNTAADEPEDLSSDVDFVEFTGAQGNTPDYNKLENDLVDTDNDGFGDAMWERAPIPLMTGVEYFMAVRVFDASSLINIRTATAATSDGDTPGTESTGYYPTGLDLSRLMKRRLSSGWDTHVNDFFTNVRAGTPGSTFPTLFGLLNLADFWTATSYNDGQIKAWYDDARQPGSLDQFAPAFLELHRRNGVDDNTDQNDYETHLADLLEDDAGYDNDSPDPITLANAEHHFLGTSANLTTNTFPSIRHLVSPLTGHALFSPNHGNMHNGAHTLKQDLVYENWGATPAATQARADAFRPRLNKCFKPGTPPANFYLGDNANATRAAGEFALAIAEYSDRDGVPTAKWTSGGVTYYGLEALPFIREVYIQHGYEKQPNPSLTWLPKAGTAGIAVEIGNPFDRPINIGGAPENPNVRVAVRTGSGAPTTYLIPANTLIPPRDAPANVEHVTIYSNPTVTHKDGPAPGTDHSNLATDLALTGTVLNAGAGTLTFGTTGATVVVALEVEVASGVWVAYDRVQHMSLNLPASYVMIAPSASMATQGIVQIAVKRDGEGIRYISNKGIAAPAPRVPDTASPTPAWPDNNYSTGIDTLDNDAKGTTGDTLLDDFQIPMANRPIFSVAELGWIVMFGFTNGANGDFPARLSGTDGTTTPVIPTKTLNFAAAPIANANNLNHAQIVLDEFTTLSPRWDGVDNDGDGTADNSDKEQFLPGTMNINTAPQHLLTYAMPLPEVVGTLEGISNDIITLRSGQNGLKSLEQLLAMASLVDTTAPGGVYDQYPLYEETVDPDTQGGQDAKYYPIANDAEAMLKKIQFLTQGLSVRSDIYAASILVKGYKSGSFGGGVIETGRILVLFSRAGLTSNTDSVDILGVYRY